MVLSMKEKIISYGKTCVYFMAIFGLFDMVTQAWTEGAVKPIHIVLSWIFGAP